jgi:hypothetical protein
METIDRVGALGVSEARRTLVTKLRCAAATPRPCLGVGGPRRHVAPEDCLRCRHAGQRHFAQPLLGSARPIERVPGLARAWTRSRTTWPDPVGYRVCETMRVAREVGGSDLGARPAEVALSPQLRGGTWAVGPLLALPSTYAPGRPTPALGWLTPAGRRDGRTRGGYL